MFKKSLPSRTGLVIGRTKHCCRKITLFIAKSNVKILFVMIFHPVENVMFYCPTFCTSPISVKMNADSVKMNAGASKIPQHYSTVCITALGRGWHLELGAI